MKNIEDYGVAIGRRRIKKWLLIALCSIGFAQAESVKEKLERWNRDKLYNALDYVPAYHAVKNVGNVFDSKSYLQSGHSTLGRLTGAGLGVTDVNYGRTAMHFAAESGSAGTVQNLLNAGYTVDATDKYGNTPMHFAAASGYGNVVLTLLQAGASPFSRNQHGDTPLMFGIAAHNAEGVDYILRDMDHDKKIVYLRTPGAGGMSPLEESVHAGSDKLTSVLLSHGANANYYNNRTGQTLLHTAAEQDLTSTTQLLLDHGANPAATNFKGELPLHVAARSHHSGVVKKLLKSGGKDQLDVKDHAGKTAVDYTQAGTGWSRMRTRQELGKWF